MGFVEPAFDRQPRRLHRRLVGVGGHADELSDHDAPRPNGLPTLARSQELKSTALR